MSNTISGSFNAVSGINDRMDTNLGHTGSVQFLFAKLQMELAQANKSQAMDKIQGIRDRQEESSRITDAINELRELKNAMGDDDSVNIANFGDIPTNMTAEQREAELEKIDAYLAEGKESQRLAKLGENGDATQAAANKTASGEKESTMMSVEMENYFKDKGMDYDARGKSRRQNAGEWDRALLSLTGRKAYIDAGAVCKQYDINMPSNGKLTKDSIDTMIASLEAKQEDIGADVQQEMVYVQDFMGQYNSFTQGSSSAISDANDTLKAIARG